MKKELLKVAIRQNALVIFDEWIVKESSVNIDETTAVLVANCSKLGFAFAEGLLHKIDSINPICKLDILKVLQEVKGVNKNWTPLVKQWNIPTGESVVDHIITFLSNFFNVNNGSKLPCGHIIPENSFPHPEEIDK